MKKILAIITPFVIAVASYAQTVTIDLDAGVLASSSGTALTDNSLVLLVASNTGVFSPLVSGSLATGNDAIVGYYPMNSTVSTVPGEVQATSNPGTTYPTEISIGTSYNGQSWTTGASFAIYWFPTIN